MHRKKLINKVLSNSYESLENTRAAITEELVKPIEKEIKGRALKALPAEEWSRLAGMHEWYVTNYALLSKAVHTQVRDLETYPKLDEADNIRKFSYAPSMDEIPLLLLTAAHCALIGASAFDKEFETNFETTGDQHIKFVEAGFLELDKGRPAT